MNKGALVRSRGEKSEMTLRDGNGKRLVPTEPLMVMECHTLQSDSVILVWHELDECISHKSD